MRFQRSATGLLHRFADLTSEPDRLTELAPFVMPVVVMGEDSIDAERTPFLAGAEVTAAAGFVPRVLLAARTGPVQLVKLGVRRPGAGNAALVEISIQGDEGFAVPPSGSNGVAYSSTTAAGSIGTVRGPDDETLWVPLEGLILPLGMQLQVRAEIAASTLSWWCAWRNVGEFTP